MDLEAYEDRYEFYEAAKRMDPNPAPKPFRASVVHLTTTFRMEDGMAVPTSPPYAVQSRGPEGFAEHYRGFDHAHAKSLTETLNLIHNA